MRNMIFGLNDLIEVARGGFLFELEDDLNLDDLITARNFLGESMLHVACARANEREVRLLIELGLPVNEPGDNGNTPLHYAARAQAPKVWDLLIENGADKTVLNGYGDLASELFD